MPAVFERGALGVQAAVECVIALADAFAVPDEDCADQRIRRGVTAAALCERNGAAHKSFVHETSFRQSKKPRRKARGK